MPLEETELEMHRPWYICHLLETSNCRFEHQREGIRAEDDSLAVLRDIYRVSISRIVERRCAVHMETHVTVHRFDLAHEVLLESPGRLRDARSRGLPLLRSRVTFDRGVGPHGHKVEELGHPLGAHEARDEHVGVGPVVLLRTAVARAYPEEPALIVVKNLGEHAGAVEMRDAQPVHTSVDPDQRCSAHVTDHTVCIDWQVSTLPVLLVLHSILAAAAATTGVHVVASVYVLLVVASVYVLVGTTTTTAALLVLGVTTLLIVATTTTTTVLLVEVAAAVLVVTGVSVILVVTSVTNTLLVVVAGATSAATILVVTAAAILLVVTVDVRCRSFLLFLLLRCWPQWICH